MLEDGLIKTIRLTRTGARSFFPLLDLTSCNLRSLLATYSGLWTFTGPAKVPTDLEDLDARAGAAAPAGPGAARSVRPARRVQVHRQCHQRRSQHQGACPEATDAANRVPSSSALPAARPPFASPARPRYPAPAPGRSPRPGLVDAPTENLGAVQVSADTLSSDPAESTVAPYPVRAPTANTRSTRRAAARTSGTPAYPPRSAAPARGRPTRPADTAIRWTRVDLHPNRALSAVPWLGGLTLWLIAL